jgi:hypothetical protein
VSIVLDRTVFWRSFGGMLASEAECRRGCANTPSAPCRRFARRMLLSAPDSDLEVIREGCAALDEGLDWMDVRRSWNARLCTCSSSAHVEFSNHQPRCQNTPSKSTKRMDVRKVTERRAAVFDRIKPPSGNWMLPRPPCLLRRHSARTCRACRRSHMRCWLRPSSLSSTSTIRLQLYGGHSTCQ